MNSINFWLSSLLSVVDIKQYIFGGVQKAHKLSESEVKLPGRSMDTLKQEFLIKTYTNPILPVNSPDPGVTRLQDQSGWVLVTTSNKHSMVGNRTAFPIYFSPGNSMIQQFYVFSILSCMIDESSCRFGNLALSFLGIHIF